MPEDGPRQPELTDNARRIFDLRYSRKDEEGNPTETPADAIRRVAENVAIPTILYEVKFPDRPLVEDDYSSWVSVPESEDYEFPLRTALRQYTWLGKSWASDLAPYISLEEVWKQGKAKWRKQAKKYAELLTDMVLVPNSPTWTGAGTPLGQYAACFPAGTPVMTERGLVPIEVIEEGDLVLTHEGRYRPVTEIFSRIYVGDLVRIDPIGRPSFESTPEHPIYVEGSDWVMSSDIVKGDQLRTPVDQTIIDLGIFDLADLAHDGMVVDIEGDLLRFRKPSAYQNSGSKPYWSNRFVTADRDLSLLMGYYCAEGSLEGDGIVRFTFGKHEKEYVEEVVDLCERIVGITPNISESSFGEWITINLYSRPFAMWAKQQFGQYSHGKSIPRWLQQADLAIQRSFLTGIFRGDGLWGTWSGQESLRITLANPSLIAQLSALIGRQGWKYSWRYVKPELARHETAQLSVVPSSVDPEWLQQTWPTREGSLVRPGWTNHGRVRAVSRRPYQGMVYNIEVEEDHSYVVEGVAVHNCFVLPIEDDLGRGRASIFETMKVAALIQQTGGGNGFDFSSLRPNGALVKASMGRSSGPVSFLKAYDAAFESIGQGGCLAPETLVMTSDGTYRLDELVTHEGWRAAGGGVWTDDGERRLLGTYNNGVAEVLRVTSDLPDLVGTPNHKVKVMTDTGPEWRRLDQLNEGDAMLVTLGGHAGSEQSLISPDRLHYNQKMPDSFPDVVDEKFAWVLGYLAGDGFVSKGDDDHRVGFSVAHSSYLIDELPAMLNSLFPGIPLRIEQKPNDASVTMVYSCRAIKDFLTLNGLGKGYSHEVSIPLKVRMSPPVVVGAFLAGLFEADGGISSGYPMLGSTSRRLVDEVSTLCIGLGIPVTTRIATASNDRFGSREMYQVRVASHYGLAQWIKCVSTHPLSRFAAIDSWVPDSQRESAYVLPCPSWWITPVLDAISVPQRGRGGGVYEASSNPGLRRKLLRYIRGDRRFTLSAYRNLSLEYEEFALHARPVDGNYFSLVCEVQDAGMIPTFDLTVEDNHTYTAYGIVTHNTRRGANMGILRVDHPSIEEFIAAKLVEGEISNFNISVAITDEFMGAVDHGGSFDLVFNGEVYKTVDPLTLWDTLIDGAWTLGDPGVFFVDRANDFNPCPTRYTLAATNPSMPAGTLVGTRHGIVPIESLEGSSFEVRSLDGEWAKAECFLSGEDEEILEIGFGNNRVTHSTKEHRWPVLGRMGGIHKVSALDLRVGDLIPLNRNEPPGISGDLSFSYEDGFFAGYLLGDGWITQRDTGPQAGKYTMGFVFDSQERELANRILDYMNDRKNDPSSITEAKGCLSIQTSSQPFIESMIQRFGVDIKKDHIPSKIWISNDACIAGFVDGWLSADGHVAVDPQPAITLTTSRPSLAEEFSKLVSFFGVNTTIYAQSQAGNFPNGRDYDGKQYQVSRVRIGWSSFESFCSVFSISHPKKAIRLSECRTVPHQRERLEGRYAKVTSIQVSGRARVWDISVDYPQHVFPSQYAYTGNCGEQALPPYSNCCLGAIAVNRFVTEEGGYDWDGFANAIHLSVEFLDDVVDANRYVPDVPELEEAAMNERRIGLGIMGLADALMMMGLPYDGYAGQSFVDLLMEFFRYHTMLASIDRAEERGAFPWISGSIYDPALLREHGEGAEVYDVTGRAGLFNLWKRPTSILPDIYPESTDSFQWNRPEVDWDLVLQGLKEHGIRNACQTTIAPTGTTSNVAGLEGSGCEPLFSLAYQRRVMQDGEDIVLDYLSPLFEQSLVDNQVPTSQILADVVTNSGSCQEVDGVPDRVKRVFVTASDISPESHVYMQAICQAWIDNAISKTINMPNESTREDVAKVYRLAWELGCKGITVYRQGSRDLEVLSSTKKEATVEVTMGAAIKEDSWPIISPMPMPDYVKIFSKSDFKGIPTRTFEIVTPRGTVHAYITELRSHPGRPFDIRLQIGKAGNDTLADVEALGRTISAGLRSGVSVEVYVEQLAELGGKSATGMGPNKVRSIADGVSKLLRILYLNGDVDALEADSEEQYETVLTTDGSVAYDICPHCQNATVVYEAGCAHCEIRLGGCGTFSACD